MYSHSKFGFVLLYTRNPQRTHAEWNTRSIWLLTPGRWPEPPLHHSATREKCPLKIKKTKQKNSSSKSKIPPDSVLVGDEFQKLIISFSRTCYLSHISAGDSIPKRSITRPPVET